MLNELIALQNICDEKEAEYVEAAKALQEVVARRTALLKQIGEEELDEAISMGVDKSLVKKWKQIKKAQ